jgi:hypothetical protein
MKIKIILNTTKGASIVKIQQFQSIEPTECARVRVAAGPIAAVDRCDCGMFQLHLGAFTLRLAPEALSSLVATLGEAVATSAAAKLGIEPLRDHDQRWSSS